MLRVEYLPYLFDSWRERQAERDERHDIIDKVVRGDFSLFDPDDEPLESKSPNMIQVALEDTAEASSLIPTIRVQPTRKGQDARAVAGRMEQIGAGYLDANEIDLLVPRSVMDAGAYGLFAWTILPDFDEKRPLIERRDPRTCYVEEGYRPGDTVRRALFARELYFTQLPRAWQDKITQQLVVDGTMIRNEGTWETATIAEIQANAKVVLVEYFDDKEMLVAALYQHSQTGLSTKTVHLPVELKRVENEIGLCPVVVESRVTLDGEFRGQFDQAVGMLEAHIRLFSLLMDYADQAVYSDIFVKDLIGEMPYGGGAYIELGPNGAIGRVPPAVSSLDVQRDLETLVDGIHLGGRWPKSRPGEIDQSIASAKFLESSVGMLNTAIRTYHQMLQRGLGKALRIAYATDRRYFPGTKVTTGILRNQEFMEEYDPSTDIDMSAKVRIEYGIGFGRDPGQSAVLHIQYSQSGLISEETVQENIDGIRNVGEERIKIDRQEFRRMALAKLLQGIEQGSIPNSALVEIDKAREKGDSLMEIFQKFVVEPEEAMREQAMPTGFGGMLGGGPTPSGPQPAPAQVPPAPGGADLLARMNMPAGPGGTLGTQVLQEGAA